MEVYIGQRNYDVVVIGSGPAGCVAAIGCRMYGLRVLLITGRVNRDSDHGARVESVHPDLLRLMDSIDLSDCITVASCGLYNGIEVNGMYNELATDTLDLTSGHHICRHTFDSALLEKVQQTGAAILYDNCVIDIKGDERRVTGLVADKAGYIECRYIIDASGHKRVAGKILKFREEFYSPPLIVWTGVSYNVAVGIFPEMRTKFAAHNTGWSWIAALPSGRCAWTRLEHKGRHQLLPPEPLREYPLLAPIATANRRWRVHRPVCKEGVVLCGDAAGIIDPAAGQGIFNAIQSAITSVRTIIMCRLKPELESIYLAQYDSWFIDNYLKKTDALKHFYKQAGISFPALSR